MTDGGVTGGGARPAVVAGAVWALVIGGVLLAAGGVVTAGVSFDTLRQVAPGSVPDESIRASLWLYRGVGILFVLAAAGLIALSLRAGRREVRFRRATTALALGITLVVAATAVLVGTHIMALLSLVPIIAGVVLMSRPVAQVWFAEAGSGDFEVGR